MKRREFLKGSATAGLVAAIPSSVFGRASAGPGATGAPRAPAAIAPLHPPGKGRIPVAFLITEGAVMIDFAGPWEVFQDVYLPSRGPDMEDQMPFNLYTVSDSTKPVRISGGLQIVPDHSFADAPEPKVIVIPAQKGGPAAVEWVRAASKNTDITMSVCTGAFLLASTGLLSGKAATTHHSSYRTFAMQFPDIRVERGVRFVDEGGIASAGGLSSGIDLALHVVARYFGADAAVATAYQMEYQGQGWSHPASNAVYAQARRGTSAHPLCPVCEMDVDPALAPKSAFKGKTYYFCSTGHKDQFDAAPEKWLGGQK
jgi:transcriptional regulator GlxA family with amidase domain